MQLNKFYKQFTAFYKIRNIPLYNKSIMVFAGYFHNILKVAQLLKLIENSQYFHFVLERILCMNLAEETVGVWTFNKLALNIRAHIPIWFSSLIFRTDQFCYHFHTILYYFTWSLSIFLIKMLLLLLSQELLVLEPNQQILNALLIFNIFFILLSVPIL